MAKFRKEDALDYHAQGRPGKIEVVPTKPYSTQRDLTLAYSPGVAEPCLEIGRQLHPGKVVILVRDNGCGIDEEMKPRIFTPNFTTKTTGSGLGLAMVKNIVEGFGGKIWFSSEKGLGTIFYLEFVRDSD